MEVTKCDRCKAYVDKSPSKMPRIEYSYGYNNGNGLEYSRKTLCYECYDKLLNWLGDDKEDKNV